MKSSPVVRSFLEIIPLEEVRPQLSEILSRDFNPSELETGRKRPVQSVAGRVALKRAICKLAAECYGLKELVPRDITIRTTAEGAPFLFHIDSGNAASDQALVSDVFVSISHSRTTATGLAVISMDAAT